MARCAVFSTVTQVYRGSTFALRRTTLDFGLGVQSSSVETHGEREYLEGMFEDGPNLVLRLQICRHLKRVPVTPRPRCVTAAPEVCNRRTQVL